MIAIIAVNNLGFIGKDNDLMWRSSEDLQHFKKMTLGKVMLVGYNTFQTLPGVVKKRDIILTNRKTFTQIRDEINLLSSGRETICIGGKKTYEKYCHLFTELHISHINDNQVGDCTFPDLKNLTPQCKVFNYNFEVDIPHSKEFNVTLENIENANIAHDLIYREPFNHIYLTKQSLNAINKHIIGLNGSAITTHIGTTLGSLKVEKFVEDPKEQRVELWTGDKNFCATFYFFDEGKNEKKMNKSFKEVSTPHVNATGWRAG